MCQCKCKRSICGGARVCECAWRQSECAVPAGRFTKIASPLPFKEAAVAGFCGAAGRLGLKQTTSPLPASPRYRPGSGVDGPGGVGERGVGGR